MTDDVVQQIVSFVLKRIGKEEASITEFYLTLSMRLQWCSPHIAQQFVKRCVQDGVLKMEKDMLSPRFSIETVSIPIGFKPSSEFFIKFKPRQAALDVDEKPDIVNQIMKETVFSKSDIFTSAEGIMKEKMINKTTALLLFAKRHAIDISPFIVDAEHVIFIENKE